MSWYHFVASSFLVLCPPPSQHTEMCSIMKEGDLSDLLPVLKQRLKNIPLMQQSFRGAFCFDRLNTIPSYRCFAGKKHWLFSSQMFVLVKNVLWMFFFKCVGGNKLQEKKKSKILSRRCIMGFLRWPGTLLFSEMYHGTDMTTFLPLLSPSVLQVWVHPLVVSFSFPWAVCLMTSTGTM